MTAGFSALGDHDVDPAFAHAPDVLHIAGDPDHFGAAGVKILNEGRRITEAGSVDGNSLIHDHLELPREEVVRPLPRELA